MPLESYGPLSLPSPDIVTGSNRPHVLAPGGISGRPAGDDSDAPPDDWCLPALYTPGTVRLVRGEALANGWWNTPGRPVTVPRAVLILAYGYGDFGPNEVASVLAGSPTYVGDLTGVDAGVGDVAADPDLDAAGVMVAAGVKDPTGDGLLGACYPSDDTLLVDHTAGFNSYVSLQTPDGLYDGGQLIVFVLMPFRYFNGYTVYEASPPDPIDAAIDTDVLDSDIAEFARFADRFSSLKVVTYHEPIPGSLPLGPAVGDRTVSDLEAALPFAAYEAAVVDGFDIEFVEYGTFDTGLGADMVSRAKTFFGI